MEHDHAQHELGAHVHGWARLDVAQEGPELALSLDSPAANIAGFEHAPTNDAERAALQNAVAALRDGAALFQFTESARCVLAESSVESDLLDPGGAAAGRDAEQDQHYQGAQGDADGPHGGEGGVHAEITVEYRFRCAQPMELGEIRVMLFERFPGIERLRVQMATDRGQWGAGLTRVNPVLRP